MKYSIKTLIPKSHSLGMMPDSIDQDFIDALYHLYKVVNSVKNNIQYIHWNAAGPRFKDIHWMTEGMYFDVAANFDYIAELNLQYGIAIGNPMLDHATGFEETKSAYDYANAVCALKKNFKNYLEALKSASNHLERLNLDHSKIDEMISTWDKELNYKLARML